MRTESFLRKAARAKAPRFLTKPFRKMLKALPLVARGFAWQGQWIKSPHRADGQPIEPNPLRSYFENLQSGPGIWKWDHYFDIYHAHFERFRGRDVHILEIGIYSGGSLRMWKDYFGPRCRVYGVDIQESCKTYEDEQVRIFIGDQRDRSFWNDFKKEVPVLDIVIDDGGHQFEQQIASLEELLPHLRPGGVYLCEDVHGAFNRFAFYMSGLIHGLNVGKIAASPRDAERAQFMRTSGFQSMIDSVHFYPFIALIKKRETWLDELASRKHGTQWQPWDPMRVGQ